MAAAPFVWRADGRPDWGVMWESFCDLALHGGPPHRGPEQALRRPAATGAAAASAPEIMAEIRRGIWETTGLFAESPAAGWVAVTCASPEMATWLAAAIVLENVEARAEDDRLLLPAGPNYRLENEVKSIVTVVAKTHHYWDAHLAAEAAATPPARPTQGAPRPLKVAVGGPAGSGKTTLIEAIGRRLDGRLTVAVPPGAATPIDHPVPDLLLVERTGSRAGVFRPEMVDATIGVLDVPTAAREGLAAAAGWRLLVLSKPDIAAELGVDVAALEREARQLRGDAAVVVVNPVAADGIDAVLSWLEHELLLGL
jgi:Ni2+-binding GTPase involved in maturation of urease and hydrogenase